MGQQRDTSLEFGGKVVHHFVTLVKEIVIESKRLVQVINQLLVEVKFSKSEVMCQ